MTTQTDLIVIAPFQFQGIAYARSAIIADPAIIAAITANAALTRNVQAIMVTGTVTSTGGTTITGGTGTSTGGSSTTGTGTSTGTTPVSTGPTLTAAQTAALAGYAALKAEADASGLVDASQNATLSAYAMRLATDETALATLQSAFAALQASGTGTATTTSGGDYSGDFSNDFGGGTTIRSAYSASGALAVSDIISVLTNTGPVAMTLAAGTTDNRLHVVKFLGSPSASLSAVIDGQQQTVTPTQAGPLKPVLSLRWLADLATYIVE